MFNNLWSEGLYGLFLYVCEALRTEGFDVVFWSPLQVKAHAREGLVRPPGWMMDKQDMVEAARTDAAGGRWDHNEADGYLVARLSGRFWEFYEGVLRLEDLTPTELKYFTEVKRPSKGRDAGREILRGVVYREDERFFLWGEKEEGRDGSNGSAAPPGEG